MPASKKLAAERKLEQALSNGTACGFIEETDQRPHKAGSNNRIRASFLRKLILNEHDGSLAHPRGIVLEGAVIECDCPSLIGPCLDLESSRIDQNIALRKCLINGPIILDGATTGSIDLSGSQIGGMSADHLRITGSLRLTDNFHATEKVRLVSADIAGSLDCSGGRFDKGINAERITVHRDVRLRSGFLAKKSVRLRNANIIEELDCSNAEFLDPHISIMANRAQVGGNFNLVRTKALGTVSAANMSIGGDFTPQHASFLHNPSLQLTGSRIAGSLIWRSLTFANGEVDFSGASCTTINMDAQSWMRRRPEYQELASNTNSDNSAASPNQDAVDKDNGDAVKFVTRLDNLTYKGFSNPPNAWGSTFWLEWLSQQPDRHLHEEFRPAPWEQLANVLDNMGHEEEARRVRIEKQKMQTRFLASNLSRDRLIEQQLRYLQLIWRHITSLAVDYGYRPGKAILWLAALTVIGSLIYSWAAHQGIMAPTHPLIFKEVKRDGQPKTGSIDAVCAINWVHLKSDDCRSQIPPEYSEFSAFMYSMDTALPVVNLRQTDDWSPRVVDHNGLPIRSGHLVRIWEWIQILLGWTLSLLFVSAIGGIIKR